MIGTTVSHYKILEKVGGGGMGVVYKAQDLKLDRTVALKFLPPELTLDFEAKERFIHEAKAASSLQHHNICTIHDIDQTSGGQMFIVMDLYEGETLKSRIARGKLRIEEATDIAIQIAQGLSEAHAHGIVHRDVKPANILITKNGIVKILDFGLAKLSGSTKLTKTGSTVGTVAYMSPEQLQGGDVDARADIFSLGVVLFEMLTGNTPFRGDHEPAIMYSILNEDPASVAQFNEKVTPEIERIVAKALAKDKDERYQHADDVLADLRTERKKPAYSKTREMGAPIPLSASSASKRWKTGLGGLAAVIIIGLGVYLFIPKTKAIDSIAILPFINVNADSSMEYLSDGITENLINSLTQLSDLRVIPRSTAFHYKGKEINPREVGNALKVRSLLTGRVIQRGSDLNIQLDLIDIATESQIWGAQYSRNLSGLATVQEEIVRGVSLKLQPGLSGDEKTKMGRGRTTSAEAFQLYLKGRFHWNKRTPESVKTSIGYFEQAIGKDPTYALAYAGLADAYVVLGEYKTASPRETFPKAKAAALKALEIDNDLAEAHTSLAAVLRNHEWDWPGAEREHKRAIDLNPNYPTGHQWYAEYLGLTGRHQEALAEILKAQELDPLSLIINSIIAWVYLTDRQYDKAIEQLRRVLDMDSTFSQAQILFVVAYESRGMNDQELAEVNRIQTKQGVSKSYIESYNRAYKSAGRKGLARLRLTQLGAASKNQSKYSSDYAYAVNYAILGEKANALRALEKCLGERDYDLTSLKLGRAFDGLRSDPRFIAILKEVGLDR